MISYALKRAITKDCGIIRNLGWIKETMNIERLKYVKKVWGEEIYLVNDGYCGKLLVVDGGTESSYHYHPKKKETFYALEGYGRLTVEGKEHNLAPFLNPKTIQPGEKHSFKTDMGMVLLEISSFHDDNDVVRITESRGSDFG